MFFTKKELEVYCPIKGEVQSIDKTPDESFANKLMGDGFVVFPKDGVVYAPFDGTITLIFPTKQAIGLVSKNKIEVLIHIGLDTNQLKGEGFEVFVKENQKVNKGDVLMKFDMISLKHKVSSFATPVIFTNLDDQPIQLLKTGNATNNDCIVRIQQP